METLHGDMNTYKVVTTVFLTKVHRQLFRKEWSFPSLALPTTCEWHSSLLFNYEPCPHHRSPERMNESGYSFKSDIWSLGCVIYEVFTVSSPPHRFSARHFLYLWSPITFFGLFYYLLSWDQLKYKEIGRLVALPLLYLVFVSSRIIHFPQSRPIPLYPV
jgi:serine/threonine protein kinase